MNKVTRLTVAIVVVLLFIMLVMVPSEAKTEHCPDHQTVEKYEGSYDSTVLDTGTEFCVKAGPLATSVLTADGTTTLGQYVDADGLRVGNDNVPGVSYYVVYAEPDPPVVDPEPTEPPVIEEPEDPTPDPTDEPNPKGTQDPEPVEELNPVHPDPEPIETPQASTGDVAGPARLADTGANTTLALLAAGLLGSGVYLTRK